MPCCNFCTFKSLIYTSHSQEGRGDSVVFRYWFLTILGDPGVTSRDEAIFLGERHFWRESLPQGLKSPWALSLTKWVPEVVEINPADWPEKYFSGQSAEFDHFDYFWNLFGEKSPWSELSRQKCRSPENIASSRLVAPGSPGIILDRLITTSVT